MGSAKEKDILLLSDSSGSLTTEKQPFHKNSGTYHPPRVEFFEKRETNIDGTKRVAYILQTSGEHGVHNGLVSDVRNGLVSDVRNGLVNDVHNGLVLDHQFYSILLSSSSYAVHTDHGPPASAETV